MWNGKFSDRATANLRPGEKVWICGGSYPNQKAVFVAHDKEKTVEVRRAPGIPTNHIRPEHVVPLSFLEVYSKAGSAAGKAKLKSGVCSKRASPAAASVVSSVTASVSSPSYDSFTVVHGSSPAKLQLQEMIEQEKEKARISQEKIVSLLNALELVERAETLSEEA